MYCLLLLTLQKMTKVVSTRTALALEKIAKHHKEFINAAKSLYGNNQEIRNYAEDYIQEVYMKLSRYDDLYDKVIKPDGTVSKGYVFFCMRSVVLNALGKKKVIKYSYEGDMFDVEQKFIGMNHENVSGIEAIIEQERDLTTVAREQVEELMYKVAEENSHWFDYNLFKTYLNTGKSFRVLAQETGLGIQTIYLSIKKTKLIIAEELFNEYSKIK